MIGCTHCMASQVFREQLPEQLVDISEKMFAQGKHTKNFFPCGKCGEELYCSDDCRELAWRDYHECLCVTQDERSENHPLLKYHSLARLEGKQACLHAPHHLHQPQHNYSHQKARQNKSITHPSNFRNGYSAGITRYLCFLLYSFNHKVKNKGYDVRKAFEPFSNFVAHEEPSPDDQIFMHLIEQHLLSSPHGSYLKEGTHTYQEAKGEEGITL